MYKAKKEATTYVDWCRSWQQANQNRPLQPVCFRPAAEHYKTLWPEPAIPGKLLHAFQRAHPVPEGQTEDDRFFVLTLIAIAEEFDGPGR